MTDSIRRHGIQLETGEIRQQYARYNASVDAAAEDQPMLAALLDTGSEAPRAATAAASGN